MANDKTTSVPVQTYGIQDQAAKRAIANLVTIVRQLAERIGNLEKQLKK